MDDATIRLAKKPKRKFFLQRLCHQSLRRRRPKMWLWRWSSHAPSCTFSSQLLPSFYSLFPILYSPSNRGKIRIPDKCHPRRRYYIWSRTYPSLVSITQTCLQLHALLPPPSVILGSYPRIWRRALARIARCVVIAIYMPGTLVMERVITNMTWSIQRWAVSEWLVLTVEII